MKSPLFRAILAAGILSVPVVTFPIFVSAHEFTFQRETNTIPVEMNGWDLFCPWVGGFTKTTPALADIDADGDLDLFFGEYMGKIAFAQNTGTPQLADFTWMGCPYDSLRTLSAGLQSDVDFADLDGDNDLDAVIGSGYVTYVENLGIPTAPNFAATPETLKTNAGSPVIATTVALADIDADGDEDLVGGYGTYLILYRNDGDTSFVQLPYPWLGITIGDGGWANPTFADIDADGDLDLFIGTYYGKIYFYQNIGTRRNCRFRLVSEFYANIDVGDKAAPEFADIDGDGDLDLFVGMEYNGDMRFYENTGTPRRARFEFVTQNYITIDVGSNSDVSAQLVDIDADGDLDMFLPSNNTICFFKNQDAGLGSTFQLADNNFQNISVPWVQPAFGDLDADGDYDLICGESVIPNTPNIWLYINQGTPERPNLQLYSSSYITNPNFFAGLAPILADIDADGDLDLFIRNGNYNLMFYENVGGPTWPNFVFITSQWQGINHEMYGFCFGDLDGDFDLDLLTSNAEEDNLYFYRNHGTPQAPVMVLETDEFLNESVQYIFAPTLSDFDQDGDLDLFVGDDGAGLYLYRNITPQLIALPVFDDLPNAGLHLSLGPNPANPLTVASFELRVASDIDLQVFDISGKLVKTLASGILPAGSHRFIWDATSTASGTYLVRLNTAQDAITQKIIIVK